ncbi:MAG: PCRF domain-containing protein, partial [Candidatus Dormibacteraceae bacterium]
MRDLEADLGALRRRLEEANQYLGLDALRGRLGRLEAEVARPDLWDDVDVGQRVTKEYGQVRGDVDLLDGLAAKVSDAETLYELAVEEGDDSVHAELEAMAGVIGSELDALELRSLFTGEHDERDAVCEVHAKDGGTDAQDWAQMMVAMYRRWA